MFYWPTVPLRCAPERGCPRLAGRNGLRPAAGHRTAATTRARRRPAGPTGPDFDPAAVPRGTAATVAGWLAAAPDDEVVLTEEDRVNEPMHSRGAEGDFVALLGGAQLACRSTPRGLRPRLPRGLRLRRAAGRLRGLVRRRRAYSTLTLFFAGRR